IKQVDVEGPSPIKIITRADIESTGRTNLTELLRDLPESSAIGINEGGTTAAVRGSTALSLRNLGANNTLVIVNGRRTVLTGNPSGGTTFVDLNRFPIAMVERVEVLKDGASAIYGADATAGVVNIILRKDFNGAETNISYGNSFNTDVAEKSYSLFAGAASGKSSATVGVTYFDRAALTAKDTTFANNADLTARYFAKDAKYADVTQIPVGFFDLRSGTGPQARIALAGLATGQINGQNGVNIPGLAAGAVITRLPGTGGTAAGTLASATPNFTNAPVNGTGGQFNAAAAATFEAQRLTAGVTTASNLYNFQDFVWLTPETKRIGFNSTYRYDLAKNVNLYSELSYQQNRSHIELAPSPISTASDNGILVPKTNYWNPFGVDVSLDYRAIDIGARKADITNNTYSILLGAKGTVLDRFDWDLGYLYGRDEATDVTTNAISESRLRASLAKTTPDALNVFGGANYHPPQSTLDSFRVQTQKAGSASLDLVDFKVSGDLFTIPTGSVGGAVYTEWRKEKFNIANDDISVKLDDIIGQVRLSDPTQARRKVKSLAGEVRVPLIRPATGTLLYKADLSVAARYESFSEGYNSGVKPYYGLRYQPIKDLVLRGSMTRAFRAPTLPQLFGGESQSLPSGLADLRRPQALTGDPFDGATTQRLVRQGGNPKLTPETAKIYSYGFVYDIPLKALKGLSFGAQYFHVEQINVITTTGTAFIRQNEVGGGTADLVIRDPGSETYTNRTANNINILTGANNTLSPVAPGQTVTVPGRIVALLDRVVNLAAQRVEGYDFDVTYDKRTANYGRFVARSTVAYSKFRGFTRTINPAQNAGRDGFPRWRAQANLGWNYRAHNASLGTSYIPSYGDYVRDGFEVDPYYAVNANYGYDFPAGLMPFLDGTRVTLGVDNALNKAPSLYRNGVGYDQSFVGRPQGRFFFVALRKTL
ncbi:MAG: hypothetical protein RLZZ15_1425, partial [Verrucomicrobiota bacterium]